jgi:hypothetical protein
VRCIAVRLVGAAVAAQVRHHHREALGKRWRYGFPHDAGLRIAVQQQQRRPRAADQRIDLDPVAGQAAAREAVDQAIGQRPRVHRARGRHCGA